VRHCPFEFGNLTGDRQHFPDQRLDQLVGRPARAIASIGRKDGPQLT
jgi:hypothetical protein